MPPHHLRTRFAVGVLLLAATLASTGCDDGLSPAQDRMRGAYAPTQQVTVGGFSWEVEMVLRRDVVYGAGLHNLVQIDRATGAVTELLVADNSYGISKIAANDTHVYAVLQVIGGDQRIVRIAKGGGATEVVFDRPNLNYEGLVARGDALYAAAYEDLGTPPPAPSGRKVLLGLTTPGQDPTMIVELPNGQVTGLVAADDGIYVGDTGDGGSVSRIPYSGGPLEILQQASVSPYYYLAADITGVYWTATRSEPGLPGTARLYVLPPGASQPTQLSAVTTPGEFTVNELGFYWVDYEARAIRAVPRDELTGEFDLISVGDQPLGIVADERALVYSSNDDDGDGGDLELHVVPRVQ